jgi:hypothetical protein
VPGAARRWKRSALLDLCFQPHEGVHCSAVRGHDSGELPLAVRNSALELAELGHACPLIFTFKHRL